VAAAPLVTVITATYNGAATLRSALASLVQQEFTDFEAWVVGDASTDDSAAVVASFGDARLQWTNRTSNSGSQSGPNAEGLRRARGTYVAYLGHDDLWFPWQLSTLVAEARRTDADLVHTLVAIIGASGAVGAIGAPPPGVPYAHHYVPPSSWLHRREIVERVGGWRPADEIWCGVDVDVMKRIAADGCRFAFAPRLSVLKFPSPWWRAYAADAPRPQGAFLDRMRANPAALEHATLTDLATVFARDRATIGELPSSNAAYLVRAVRTVFRRGIRDRWFESGVLQRVERWRFQRHRERIRLRRGLPPSKSIPD